MSYRIKRVDLNQAKIVKQFRSLGVKVLILSEVGKGCPDLLIAIPRAGKHGFMMLIEVKNGDLYPSAQKLTECEHRFHEEWGEFVMIVNSLEGAFDLVQKVLAGEL